MKLSNNDVVKYFELSAKCPWVYVVTSSNVLEIFAINEDETEKVTKICSIKDVLGLREVHESLVLDCVDNFYRVAPLELVMSYGSSSKK